MHQGTSLSTFMSHNYSLGDKTVGGAEIMKAVVDEVNIALEHAFCGPGEMVEWLGDKVAAFPRSGPQGLKKIYEIISFAFNEFAKGMGLLPEDVEDVENLMCDILMTEINLVTRIKSHRHAHNKATRRKAPDHKKEETFLNKNLEKEFEKLIIQLRIDDRLFEKLNGIV